MLTELAEAFTAIPLNRMLGIQIDELNAEKVIMRFSMKEDLIGNFLHGILHGGVISTVFDTAGGILVMAAAILKNAHLSQAELMEIVGKTSTVDLQISYLRPGRGETFTTIAELIKQGSSLSFTRMQLHNQKNELIATGNGTYIVR